MEKEVKMLWGYLRRRYIHRMIEKGYIMLFIL